MFEVVLTLTAFTTSLGAISRYVTMHTRQFPHDYETDEAQWARTLE